VPEVVAERLASLSQVGVTDVIVDVDWVRDDGPERSATALIERRPR